ncbi:MAG TPA: DUF3105 domain-containing protein [Ktedonobacterales bacterium]|nr:DUF3105 domain-containing protein [Ktedonobacterales bacterium]
MSSQRGSSPKTRSQPKQPVQSKPSTTSSRESRREEIERRKQERQREVARQARIQRLKWRGVWVTGIVGAVLVVVLIVRAVTSGGAAPIGNISGVKTYANLARDHVSGTVAYPQKPPVGGPHNAVWLNCGIYEAPVASENAVHSLEHGAVWITYQPKLAAADIQHLVSLVKGHAYVILSPYDGLPTLVVASAWGVQLQLQTAYDSRIPQFIQKYAQGAQTPEPGASCSGGTGSPVE